MKERIVLGLFLGAIIGFLGSRQFAETARGTLLFVAWSSFGFAALFAVVTKKAIERIQYFFTHFL